MLPTSNSETKSPLILQIPMLGIWTVIVLFLSFPVSARPGQKTIDGPRKPLIERLRSSPDVSASVENSAEIPLIIQEAKVKEITGTKYQKLTGTGPASDQYSSFPKVTLVNSGSLRIIGFALAIKNERTGRIHVVKVREVSIQPRDTFTVNVNQWAVPEHQTRIVLEDGAATSVVTHPALDLDSPKLWLPGNGKDLHVIVGLVEFEDGTRWTTKN